MGVMTRKSSTTRKKSSKPKIGRPLAVVDEERVAELAYKGLSNKKIATLVGISDTQLGERFLALLAKKRAERTLHICERQLAMLNGPIGPSSAATMAIWLGKNELGQTDKAAVEHSGGLKVQVIITDDKGDSVK